MTIRHRPKNLLTIAAVAMATLVLTTTAHAVPIEVFYDSFEDLDISGEASGQLDNPNPTGWFDVGHPNTAGTIHNNSPYLNTPFGDQALKVWQGNQGGARKNLVDVLEADMEYVISFNVSPRDNRSTGDYRAELWGGSSHADVDLTLLDSFEGTMTDLNMLDSAMHTFDTSGGNIGDSLQLRLVDPESGQVTGAWQDGPYYDNVLLTKESTLVAPAVPEPASIAIWSLLGLCLAGYGYRRRR